MKRVRVEQMSRNFGCKADWYKHENVAEVEAANPVYRCGNKWFPAAYFVVVEEQCYDPMREFNCHYWATVENIGPFASEAAAKAAADAVAC